MAKLYGEIAAKALLTLDKSFARANGQPLDASEVYYSLAAAQEYAAGAQAYIGQKIVVIEDGVVTHYGIEDEAGTLKELGAKPVGDEKSIAIAEDGTVSLVGVGSLVFERDIIGEDGKPTGEKESVQYQPLMTKNGLVWVEPSKTTVEGLSLLIEGLTGRMDTAEADIEAAEKAIADEVDRAKEAEKALGERIDAIDFMDADEVAEAIEAAREEISAEIDSDVAVAQKKADDAYALAETKVDATTYATDKKALEDEDAAIREIAEGVRDAFNTFLTSEEVDNTVNTLKEIQAEIEKMTDATELATALASKADTTYVDEELAKKQDVIPEGTYDAYGAAATAKSEAIADAEGKIATAKSEAAQDATNKAAQALADAKADAAGLYATKTYVGTIPTSYTEDNVISYINKKAEETLAAAQGGSSETAASVKQQLDNYKSENDTKVEANTTAITNINNKLTTIEENAEVNIIETVKINGEALTVDADRAVNVVVPTKFTDITDNSGFDERITAAQNKADKGVTDASAAQTTANEAKALAEDNQAALGTLTGTVAGHTTTIGEHTTAITELQNADIAHAAEYEALSGIVGGHTEAIAKKAEQTALDAVSQKASANESAIQTINETTIPAVVTEVNKKANSADVYTKTEVNAITGTPAEGKTLIQMIEEAQAAATYDDTTIKALIKTNTDAIAVLNGDVETEGSVAKIAKKAADDAVAVVIGAAPEAMDTLEEVAAWIANDQSGAAAMAADIKTNKDAIAAINHAETGILAQAKDYADSVVAGIPAATVEKLGLVKFDGTTIVMNENNQLYVAKVSTDVLEQGETELILNGGSAQ